MVITDLNIICIAQRRRSFPQNRKGFFIETHDRNHRNLRPVYGDDRFPLAQVLHGWWYRIYPAEPAIYEDAFFDLADVYHTLRVRPHWMDTVKELLSFYLEQSPCGQIAVVIYLRSSIKECVHETCTLNFYMQELIAGKINYNHLYHITK